MIDYSDISRRMSYGLRHNPAVFGVELDALEEVWDGFVPISIVLKALKISREMLDATVAADSKGRFEINGDRIRACQGHSVPVELNLPVSTPPAVLFHGTTANAWQEIQQTGGLRPMARHAVHLSPTLATATQVGNRHVKKANPLVLLAVDAKSMVEQGYKFRVSANGVWLIDDVPVPFLSVVREEQPR